MKKLILLILIFISSIAITPNGKLYPQNLPLEPIKIPTEIKYLQVKQLLSKVPKNELEEFVNILKEFADKRNFDWRVCLLVMWNESIVNTKAVSGNYAGLIMFGKEARKILGVSKEQLLSMNFIEQAKAAVIIWEGSERMMKTKIKDFSDLQMATFVPAWMNHPGNPYPSNEAIKAGNWPFCGKDGEISKESILNFYRKKINLYEELKYFRGKI
jgi:hypothetical protein